MILLDTDFDTDCDDAGALAVLHALANRRECNILGVICSVPIPACVGAVRAVNEACGRPGIQVGLVQVADYASDPYWQPYRDHRALLKGHANGRLRLYNEVITSRRSAGDVPAEDAVTLYRRLLAEAEDNSVKVCGIGTLTALAQLLESGPDFISPLSGRELVAAKVQELVSMASASYPAGMEVFNWRMDPRAAATVLRDWPTVITVSPAGSEVLTGANLSGRLPENHPLRTAYEVFLGGPHRNRPSWDQLAVLHAVRGAMGGAFEVSENFGIALDAVTAEYRWTSPSGAVRRYVKPALPVENLAELIESLMIAGAH